MLENPDVQRKGQEELDRVVGRGRVPDFSDKVNLPYMMAMYKEVLRLRPSVPMGFPHGVISDDVYKGMRIPRGATIVPNIWFVIHQ